MLDSRFALIILCPFFISVEQLLTVPAWTETAKLSRTSAKRHPRRTASRGTRAWRRVSRAMREARRLAGRESVLKFGAETRLVTVLMAAGLARHGDGLFPWDARRTPKKCRAVHRANVDVIESGVPAQLHDATFDFIYRYMIPPRHVADVRGLLSRLAGHLCSAGVSRSPISTRKAAASTLNALEASCITASIDPLSAAGRERRSLPARAP